MKILNYVDLLKVNINIYLYFFQLKMNFLKSYLASSLDCLSILKIEI